MRLSLASMLCILAALMAAILGGCSGAGQTAAQARGETVQALATNQVSAALLLKEVLLFLYQDSGMSFSATASVAPRAGTRMAPKAAAPVPPPLTPDPSKAIDFEASEVNSDGSAWHGIMYTDCSGIESVAWPDGRTKFIWWGVPTTDPDGVVLAYDGGETWGDGTVLAYSWQLLAYKVAADYHNRQSGTLTGRDGKVVRFVVDFFEMKCHEVHLDLPDGTALDATIPLAIVTWKPIWPDFVAGFSGTYAGQQFTMRGTADFRWTSLDFASADGKSARYSLGSELNGSGQITQGGQLLGALSWDATQSGKLERIDQSAVAVTPTDAARRFEIDQWIRSVASMAAMPAW